MRDLFENIVFIVDDAAKTLVRNLLVVAVAVVLALGVSPAIAAASGGTTIAGAPNLVLGTTVSSGWSDQFVFGSTEGELWKVPLTGGQTLTVSTSGLTGNVGCLGLIMDVYAPGVTDATVATAATAWTQQSQLTFVAPYTGTWTLLVTDSACTGGSDNTVSYDYTAAIEPSKGEPRTGGTTIAGAPNLVLGTTVSSGWSHQFAFGSTEGEFWRVPLTGGQTLTVSPSDLTGNAGCLGVIMDVYAPGVTDSTVAGAATAWTQQSQLTFVAPYSGTWTLLVSDSACTGSPGGNTVSYNYIAAVAPSKGAAATGATTIAGAPNLVLGTTVSSGWSHQFVFGSTEGEFWKVPLTGGQTLSVSSSGLIGNAGCLGLNMNMYAPTVTDATVAGESPVATQANQLTFVAPYSGTWTLLVSDSACTGSPAGNTVSYNYIAAVTQATVPADAVMAVARQSDTVSRSGRLALAVSCSNAPCGGTIKLTATTRKTTGRGRRKRTRLTAVTIGAASFSGLTPGTHRISITLNRTGLELLRHDHKLSVTAQATYKSGSASETARAAISLEAAKKTSRHTPLLG
jgi:hypothetical protein